MEASFWTQLDTLIRSSALVIDRPKGFSRPHAPSVVYPLDYGYLQGTASSDGEGIDVWRGSLFRKDTLTPWCALWTSRSGMLKLNFCSAVPPLRKTLSAIFIKVQLQPRSLSKGAHDD